MAPSGKPEWDNAGSNSVPNVCLFICHLPILWRLQVWAQVEFGSVTLATTGADYPMLAGNLTSILVSGLVVLVTGLIAPQNYDWKSTHEITMVEQEETGAHTLYPSHITCSVCFHASPFPALCLHQATTVTTDYS